jgi:menaquinone-dependent protoporphyrinogen IX oxidase
MNGLVVYASNCGATAQYARWLGEALGFAVAAVGKARDLGKYDSILIGTNVRQGRLMIAPWVKRNWPMLRDKRLAFFSTSGTPKRSPELRERYTAEFDEEVRARMPYFPLDGRKFFRDMSWLDRAMMRLVIKGTEKSRPEIAARMAEEFDRLNRDDIGPIVASITPHA